MKYRVFVKVYGVRHEHPASPFTSIKSAREALKYLDNIPKSGRPWIQKAGTRKKIL